MNIVLISAGITSMAVGGYMFRKNKNKKEWTILIIVGAVLTVVGILKRKSKEVKRLKSVDNDITAKVIKSCGSTLNQLINFSPNLSSVNDLVEIIKSFQQDLKEEDSPCRNAMIDQVSSEVSALCANDSVNTMANCVIDKFTNLTDEQIYDIAKLGYIGYSNSVTSGEDIMEIVRPYINCFEQCQRI